VHSELQVKLNRSKNESFKLVMNRIEEIRQKMAMLKAEQPMVSIELEHHVYLIYFWRIGWWRRTHTKSMTFQFLKCRNIIWVAMKFEVLSKWVQFLLFSRPLTKIEWDKTNESNRWEILPFPNYWHWSISFSLDSLGLNYHCINSLEIDGEPMYI